MARTANASRGQSAARLLGLETEYGFAVLGPGGARLEPRRCAERLVRALAKLVASLRCTSDTDLFIANGSRVYVDSGLHPEVATPECSTPEEAILFTRAGDRLLARAARAMERARWRRAVEAVLWKGNVDHRTGATWASHESYLHECPLQLLAEHLMTHLVTRTIYTGAGGFDNRAPGLRFLVSPRASHLVCPISAGSTSGRGIFHTRDEPLARAPYRRLHVLAGESLWSETADYLRVGTTALLVAQVDAGRRPQTGLDLASPIEALATVASDVRCTATLALRASGPLTAIAIQRRLLEGVEADLGAEHLPPWASSVCERWRVVLDRLESSPSRLVGVLDWPSKLAVLERQCESQGLRWTFSGETAGRAGSTPSRRHPDAPDPAAVARLLETDTRFNRLDDSGIFAILDRDGALAHRVVSPDDVATAQREPPAVGRARVRAACVESLAGKRSVISCHWDRVVDHESETVLSLDDPFQCEGGKWTPLPPPRRSSPAWTDPIVAPIDHAVSAGAPRQALRRMRAMLAGADAVSPALCRYCTSIIRGLVPCVPVPRLRRGGATAGAVLTVLFERASRHGDYWLERSVGTLLYRFYEARGRYDRARLVVERLLARAQEHADRDEIAMLTNNVGYEHLLAGDHEPAEILFDRSIALFEAAGRAIEAANVRANLLECRFARTEPEAWDALVPRLEEVNRTLTEAGDWRARKSMRLLARHAEQRGRWRAARRWARRAIAATQGVPTQLRDWDLDYLRRLESGPPAAARRRRSPGGSGATGRAD